MQQRERERTARCFGVTATDFPERAQRLGVDDFVSAADGALLADYSVLLNLAQAPGADRDALRRLVCDELMLSGVLHVLTHVAPALLRAVARAHGIALADTDTDATIADWVMCVAFKLDPLPGSRPPVLSSDSSKVENDGGDKGEKGEEEEEEEDNGSADEPAEKRQKTTTAGGSAAKRSSAKKKEEGPTEEEDATEKGDAKLAEQGYYTEDGKWVHPPFELIMARKFDAQGLYNNFNLPDLVEFCRLHGLPLSSAKKKNALIRVILQYAETGVVPQSGKRKSGGGARRASSSSSSGKKTGEEEEEDAEEEAEDAEQTTTSPS